MTRHLTRLAASLAVLLPVLAGTPATAEPRQQLAYTVTADDRQLLTQIETYLNGFSSLKARFVQVTDDGRYSEGKLFFERPNKLRFEYEPPVPIMIIANRGQLIYIDKELDQFTYVPVRSTPLAFLTRETIRFDDEVIVSGIERARGVLRVGVLQADDPEAGELVLTFSAQPLELRKWSVTDAEGVTINVALFNTRKNETLDDDLFEFIDPRFRD